MSKDKKTVAVDTDTVLDTNNVSEQVEETTQTTLEAITTKVDMLTPNTPKVKVPLTEDQKRIMSHQAIKAYYNS